MIQHSNCTVKPNSEEYILTRIHVKNTYNACCLTIYMQVCGKSLFVMNEKRKTGINVMFMEASCL